MAINSADYSQDFIKELSGKTVVVKYGGNAMINAALKAGVIEDVVFLTKAGIRVILVHGGGPEIDGMLKAVGKESRFVQGLRYTDSQTMEIVQMVLCGKVNKDICALVQNTGGQAIGLCGIDGGLLQANRIKTADLGLVGEIETVHPQFLESLLKSGIIPVISPVALGCGADKGQVFNVNADTAAAKIAAALQAEKLVLITDVQGIMKDVHDSSSLIRRTNRAELAALKESGVLKTGMIPKADCCALALSGGVKSAHIIDGRVPHSILTELFSSSGCGTLIG
ncbi:acetylglutamate kinase [Spirochaetia bacterium]|nr:acetylglutamate kinase [Spirochaetia bacterium]